MKKTEKEVFSSHRRQLFSLDKKIHQKAISLDDIGDLIPGILHINRKEDLAVDYMNENGLQIAGYTLDELRSLETEFFDKHLNPVVTKYLMPKILHFYNLQDETKTYSFLQEYRVDEKSEYEILFTTTKIYRQGAGLISIMQRMKNLENMVNKLEKLLEDSLFLKKNFERFSSLTKREKEILQLVALGIKRKDIADQLFISKHTYDNHRKHIREKLEIRSFSELIKYAEVFGLV